MLRFPVASRRYPLLALAVLASALATVPTARTAGADSPVTLTLTPAGGTTVHGTVPVTVTITSTDPEAVPDGSTVSVSLEPKQTAGAANRPVQAQLTVPNGCASSCQVSAVLDSAARTLGDLTAPTAKLTPVALTDGTALLNAVLFTADRQWVTSTGVNVIVDNGRPRTAVTVDPTEVLTVDGATGLEVPITVTANPRTRSPITELHLWRPGAWNGGTGTVEQVMARPASGGPWRLRADTGSMPTGSFSRMWIAARAADGTWSAWQGLDVRHSRGFTVDVAGLSTDGTPVLADATHSVTLTPHYGTRLANTWMSVAATSIDGAAQSWQPLPTGNAYSVADGSPVTLPLRPLPPGRRTVGFVLRDSWGIQRTTNVPVTVTPVLTATGSLPASIWAGQIVPFSYTLTSSTEPITSWSLNDGTSSLAGGLVLGAGTLDAAQTVTATGTLVTQQPGWYSVYASAVQTDGDSVDTPAWRYYVRPDATSATVRVSDGGGKTISTARYGTPVYLRGTVRVADGPRRGQGLYAHPVEAQFRAVGTTTWRTVVKGTAAADGSFLVRVQPTGAGSWRVHVPAASTSGVTTSPSASPQVAFTVSAAVSTSGPSTVRARTVRTYSAKALPYESGIRLTVRYRKRGTSTWYTLAHPAVRSDGTASWTATLPARYGDWVWEVSRPATTRIRSGSASHLLSVNS